MSGVFVSGTACGGDPMDVPDRDADIVTELRDLALSYDVSSITARTLDIAATAVENLRVGLDAKQLEIVALTEERDHLLRRLMPPKCDQCDGSGLVLNVHGEPDDCRCVRRASEDEARLRSVDGFYADPVEDIAHALAAELDVAELSPNDFVTVNREKLRGIARRVIAKASASSEGTGNG